VFGAVVSTKWRVKSRWYGGTTQKDSFLWRLKKARPSSSVNGSFGENNNNDDDDDDDNELEIYPNTNVDTMVQYCTEKALAIGGGTDWSRLRDGCPYGPDEPQGIGLLIDGDLMGGESNSCVTFANPSLCRRSHHAATNEFDVKTLEVWTTTPCSTVPEAEWHEMRGGTSAAVTEETTAVVERSNNIFACVRHR
jgi:TLD